MTVHDATVVAQVGPLDRPVPAPGGPQAGYRPHLDGLRAVAVYLVVAFHAGLGRFAGGFIGVDVFFVLSGYLVTELLLRDLASQGSIRLWRFYSRRFRRLLPAAVATLVVTAVVFSAVGPVDQLDQARSAFTACFLYVANWFFVHESTSYFADASARSPVLHFWSLAVEEQFYLVWPVLLGGLFWAGRRLGRHRWSAVRSVVAAGALASLGWAFVLKGAHPDRAYFGTDTRAYQLLAGALVALVPGLVPRVSRFGRALSVAAGAALVALVVAGSWLVDLDPIERGVAATVITVGLIVVLEARPAGPVPRALSVGPLVYLGRISYGTYLWHWPVIIVAGLVASPGQRAMVGLATLVATALASLSYHLLENPIRISPFLDGHRRMVVAAGLTISLVGGLVVMPQILGPDLSAGTASAPLSTSGFHPVPADFDMGAVYYGKFGRTVDCVDKAASACTIVRGTGAHILLMGDSNAQMMIPAFERLARTEHLTLSLAVTEGCLWQRDVYHMRPEVIARCKRSKSDWYQRLVPELHPDLIVVMNVSEPDGPRTRFEPSAFNESLRSSTVSSLRFLAQGRDVLVLEPIPNTTPEQNPLKCLDRAQVIEECRFVAPPGPTWLEVIERQQAEENPRVHTLDIDRLTCPFDPICDPIIGGRVVYWNNAHLTAAFSQTLAPALGARLRRLGLLPEPGQ